ncbi:hypothetical protein LINGRAHAP2_LOCUS28837 [Linum grandiflorum]
MENSDVPPVLISLPKTDPPSTVTASSIGGSYTDHLANPLFLSPGDSLSAPLISIKLTNVNYHVWSRSLSVALIIKNKVPFIDGSLPVPDPSASTYAAWTRCNFAVLNWIYNSISEDIAQSLLAYDNATHAWKDLKLRFSQGDAIRIADLQARIASYDQGDISITQYFTNLKVL